MRILILTSIYDFNDKGNLNVDMIDEFARNGHKVTVMTPKERKYHPDEKKENHGNITSFQFKCLNFRGKVNLVEKGISTLSLGYQYKRKWKKYFLNEKYDIIIYMTLPITYSPILRYLKKKCDPFCYLQQKDFFPQSALDLGILRKNSVLYKVFRHIEKQLFADSDKIGVLSRKNIDFILDHNPGMNVNKVEVCPNTITPTSDDILAKIKKNKKIIRSKHDLPTDKVIFLYGGIISRSQGVSFIKEVLSQFTLNPISNAFILIIGSGNEYDELEKHIKLLNNLNIRIMPFMPKKKFDEILGAADVGMVFLSPKFSIANHPSRSLAHMDMAQPIVAATDAYTDYKEFLECNEIGLWCLNGDLDKMMENMRILTVDTEFRERCGQNSRNYLLNEATASRAYEIIMNSYEKACKVKHCKGK